MNERNNLFPFAIQQIITHAGNFHADEVLAVAVLRALGCTAPLSRSFQISDEQLSDPNILVLDVGLHYQPENGNFDHHQDKDLPSTNVLILEHFARPQLGNGVCDRLRSTWFDRVSQVDRGEVVLSGEGSLEFNSMIRAFNAVENGFDTALSLTCQILAAQLMSASKALADVSRWNALYKRGNVAFQDSTEVILCWKEKAREENILLLVCPNPRGGYSLISRDTNELVIPEQAHQRFRHASGFMATYADKASASTAALALAAEHAGQVVYAEP